MKFNSMAIVTLISIPLLVSCGKADSNTNSSSLAGDSSKKSDSDSGNKNVFNLADYLKTSEYTPLIKPYVATGDIIFGDLQKIGIRTNIRVDSKGKSKFSPTGSASTTGQYYLNGAVYPDGVKIAGKLYKVEQINKEHEIVDIQASASLSHVGIQGRIRTFGDTKYEFNQEAKYHNSFMRALTVKYPVTLGVNVGAEIGGEISFDAEVISRPDQALSLRFEPEVKIHTKIIGEVEALKLASVEIQGITTLLSAKIGTSASLSFVPGTDLTYGDVSLDTSDIKAVDGEVKLVAKAGLENIFKSLIGSNTAIDQIWTNLEKVTGLKLSWKWEYKIWDPQPVLSTTIPARGIIYTSSMAGMTSADCLKVSADLNEGATVMEKEMNDAKEEYEKSIARTALANLFSTLSLVNMTCGK